MSKSGRDTYLLVDIAHNSTKAYLIQKKNITGKAQTQTTVNEPTLDVTKGVTEALQKIEHEKRIQLLTSDGIEQGIKLICSSNTSGGLHMAVTGVISNISGESAQRAALGAGALLIDTFSKDDNRPEYKKIASMRSMKPDIFLMSGGTDGGATNQVLEMAEIVKKSDVKPRFGEEYKLPLIYAGNVSIRNEVESILGDDRYALKMVENVRPFINKENLGPSRESIYDTYMEHVIIHSPGYQKLANWTDERIVPSQAMTGKLLYEYAVKEDINLIAADIGGDTVDIYSVYDGVFNRSLNAGIGLTYGISKIVKETGIENVLRWLSPLKEERRVRNIIGNMMIRPYKELSIEEKEIQSAVVREAIRLGMEKHKEVASRLKGVITERTLSDMFDQALEPTLINMMKTHVIIGKGEVFKTQTIEESTRIILDSMQPIGLSELYLDSENMAAPLGNLLSQDRKTALKLYTENGLRFMGTCIAPSGLLKEEKECLKIEFNLNGVKKTHLFSYGELNILPLEEGREIDLLLVPMRMDMGKGIGRSINKEVKTGELGLIIDTRGRPMERYKQFVKLLSLDEMRRE